MIILSYIPQPHQEAFHRQYALIKAYFGGYGSGKTTTACQEVIRHVLSTTNGTTLIGAATLPQLEQTAMKEFLDRFPEELIVHYNKQKNFLDVINGHRVIFRPLDDEGKARSLNLSCAWIEEASEVNYEYFVQLQTRMRNENTEQHMIILSSNPDIGWIKEEILLKSGAIYGSDVNYYIRDEDRNPNIIVHIAPTRFNKYLPPGYEEKLRMGKPDWWVRRFLEGSFENKQGLVYPDFTDHIIDDFEIPRHWERIAAADFGILDPTVFLMGAIDPETGIVYLYKEYYKVGESVPIHAKNIRELVRDVYTFRGLPVGDPSGAYRGKVDGRSLFSHYADHGVYFKAGDNRIDAGIQKVNAFLTQAKLKIFKSLKETIDEAVAYKYKEKSMDYEGPLDDKPIDKNNHCMDALRYMIQDLPDDPNALIIMKSSQYEKFTTTLPHALIDDEETGTAESWYAWY
ncbi:phage terminase large subunit [Paenibacillus larvae]